MEIGAIAVEATKEIGKAAKKVADVQQKIDKATRSVEITKKISDEKTGNYVGNEIINKVKVSLSESLNKYFEGKETINNNTSEDTWNKSIENNHKEVGLNNENQPSIGDENVGKLKLEDGLNNYFNSKESVEGSTENSIDKQVINNTNETDTTEVKRIPTRNEGLEGKNHPETGVPFDTKVVENSDGELVEVVVPEFDSEFEAQLPDELCEANDNTQFDECNKQLKEAIENNPELREKFTDEQIEQILDGETPDGFTWHHDAEKSKMQLVDSEVHAKTGHTGGRSIWGGGTKNR